MNLHSLLVKQVEKGEAPCQLLLGSEMWSKVPELGHLKISGATPPCSWLVASLFPRESGSRPVDPGAWQERVLPWILAPPRR